MMGTLADALVYAQENGACTLAAYGESYAEHAHGTIKILQSIDADETSQIAAALVAPAEYLLVPNIEKKFGSDVAKLVAATRDIQRLRTLHTEFTKQTKEFMSTQTETLRRMVLSMASDIRVVLLRLASRLQTLRFHVLIQSPPAIGISQETLTVLAPLANRLGLWQLKWELEDLAFRFMEPEIYKNLAKQLEERRVERENFIAESTLTLSNSLIKSGIYAQVSGRPKHIFSIYNKIRSKGGDLSKITDLRGLRIIVGNIAQCYGALDVVHELWPPLQEEYNDYIARPKPNGYQSLHTIVHAADGKPLEVQIRTDSMHKFAEYGAASHWRYKEKNTENHSSSCLTEKTSDYHEQRVAWMRQLLSWERDIGKALGSSQSEPPETESRIYVLTPQARVIELPEGSTPIDFAYHVHTSLGERCRGARVDGHLVPLNRILKNAQTVEIITVKDTGKAGPSRDWLNLDLHYTCSARTRAKIRQWFNARELKRNIAAGREKVMRVLQKENSNPTPSLEELAKQAGYRDCSALFSAAAREEISSRQIEELLHKTTPPVGPTKKESPKQFNKSIGVRKQFSQVKNSILILGVSSLLTHLARCCKPVPPDKINGFVVKGKGVSVHRQDCAMLKRALLKLPNRIVPTEWDYNVLNNLKEKANFLVELEIAANSRNRIWEEVTETFTRAQITFNSLQKWIHKDKHFSRYAINIIDGNQLAKLINELSKIEGIQKISRR